MTTTGVARAVDAHGRARFGTRIRVPGCEEEEELVVFAWEDGPLFDGAPLREVRSSSAYGIKVYQAEGSTKEALACPPETMASPPRTCYVLLPIGEPVGLGFTSWHVRKDGACVLRFAQHGNPRLNGLPVVEKKSGELVGVYDARGWEYGDMAECVPRDVLLAPGIELSGEWDARRGSRDAHWGLSVDRPSIPRAFVLNERDVLAECEGRAKWSAHLSPKQEFTYENECRILMDGFDAAVRKLERGATELAWVNGATLAVTCRPVGVGFAFRAPALPAQDAPAGTEGFPCVDWY